MRMSRKGRHRLEEAARLEEEGRKRWEPVAFRMSRKRRKRLAMAQDGEEPRLKRFVLQNLRMTRSRKRKMREDAALRQTAQAASISALALLPAAASEAAGVSNVLNDIPAVFDSLRNDRNRIRDFHAAIRNAKEAAAALTQAEQDLQMARQDKESAEKGLAEARQNLEIARLNLQRIAQELANAQLESAQRTREAIAAQQAVADFAPRVWAQESVVQSVRGQQQSVQATYEQLGRELGYLRDERDDLEERIRKAWESVDYAQNRLNDVMAMVSRVQAAIPEQSAKEAQWQEYDRELAALDSEVDSAEALLDDLNSQLDALQDAREAAEDAERDARELVKDLQEQQADGQREVKDSEQYVAEAEQWNEEAIRGVETAEQNLTTTQAWKKKADYDLEHFGEGKGFSTGFEYYNWHGAGLPNGHQLYQPIEFYAAEKKWDFSLATGWLSSDTGLPNGHVSGWTDTNLGITYKNNHKINDVHYSLNINVPTGKENVHQNAMMADNLARFNSFSEGWQFTPGIEATHRFTERDSITGRLNYTFRGDYKYRRSYAEEEKEALKYEMNQITNIATRIGYVAKHGPDVYDLQAIANDVEMASYWYMYKGLLKEITSEDSMYSLRDYANMIDELMSKSNDAEDDYMKLITSSDEDKASLLKGLNCTEEKIPAYQGMLSVLYKCGVVDFSMLKNYYQYTRLLYGTDEGTGNIKIQNALSLKLFELVAKLAALSNNKDDYEAWAIEKSNVWESLESQQGNVEFVALLNELKGDYSLYEFLNYPVEYLMTYGINVNDAVDEETNNITEDALKKSLEKNALWKEQNEEQKVKLCRALLAAMKIVNFLGYSNISEVYTRFEELKDTGYFADVDKTIQQIEEVKDKSADLSGYQPGVAAYLLSSRNIADIETQEEIDPGNKFQQELEYRHIGEANQLSVKFTHVNATHADYKSTLTSFTDDAGHVYGLNLPYGSGRNYDGEEWTLQVFNSQDIDRRNSLQYYVIGNYQAADAGGTHRYYGGLGWTHQFDKKQSAYALLNYGETHGQSYNWRTGKYDSGRVMKALVLGYDYRLNDVSELRAKLERYQINGSSSDSYNGWKMSLMWNKSF